MIYEALPSTAKISIRFNRVRHTCFGLCGFLVAEVGVAATGLEEVEEVEGGTDGLLDLLVLFELFKLLDKFLDLFDNFVFVFELFKALFAFAALSLDIGNE